MSQSSQLVGSCKRRQVTTAHTFTNLAGMREAGCASAMARYERCAGPSSIAAMARAAAARTCSS